MIDRTYLSRKALENLIEIGIGIPHLDSIIEEIGDLVVTYNEMLEI
jgi:hypothetical protein